MARRGKWIIAAAAALLLLTMGYVANAWFLSLSQTPAGLVRSALVRCLPEVGPERDVDSLTTYGSLISGSSVDTDGVPLVLPGDSLLSYASCQISPADGNTPSVTTRTVRTSLARPYQPGETVDTIIYGEVRQAGDGSSATRTQRDLMAKSSDDIWTKDGVAVPDPSPLNPAKYGISATVTTETTGQNAPVTVTKTILTTTYTALAEETPSYVHIQTSIESVTHEAAAYAPSQAEFDASPALPAAKTTERVLSIPADVTLTGGVTRTYLLIEESHASDPSDVGYDPRPLPLALGNVSTTDVNIRVGITAVLTKNGAAEALALRQGTGNAAGLWFLGKEAPDGAFVELFAFQPAASGDYHWVHAADASADTAWSLWDLTLIPADGGDTATIPAPVPESEDKAAAIPRYDVLSRLSVVSASNFGMEKTAFETAFNDFFCTGSPIIDLKVHFYVRQAEYMDWSEFYTQDLTFSVTP